MLLKKETFFLASFYKCA